MYIYIYIIDLIYIVSSYEPKWSSYNMDRFFLLNLPENEVRENIVFTDQYWDLFNFELNF